MGLTAALVGGGALLGGLAGSQSKGGGTTTSVSEPWKVQQPFLQYGFEQAKDATGSALANPVYQGQRVAGLNPYTSGMAGMAGDYAMNNFSALGGLNNTSMGLIDTGGQFGSNAANLFNQYSGDPTQAIITNAGQFADNPYLTGMIDASSRDVVRNLYENQLPTLARAATGSGNINSTRAGVQNAITMRGAEDRLADMSSNLRGQFFGKGLDMSQNQYNQNLTNALNANRQLSDSFASGFRGLADTQNLASSLTQMGVNAGGTLQGQEQRELDAQMARFAEERGVPLDILKQYMGIVGGNYGGTNTSTSPQVGGGWQGALQGALGGALGGYGLAGGSFGGVGAGLASNALTGMGGTSTGMLSSFGAGP
jgi:hypothetical protein